MSSIDTELDLDRYLRASKKVVLDLDRIPPAHLEDPCLLATSGTEVMARLLFDTGVLIDHLEGRRALPVGNDLAYSCVSRAELDSWTAADEDLLDAFFGPLEEIVLDREVAEEARRIRRGIRIKLPDALIAATALVTRRELVTRNAKDFRKVKGLRLASHKRTSPASLTLYMAKPIRQLTRCSSDCKPLPSRVKSGSQAPRVFWASLPEPPGSEPGYRRPVLIVQADSYNRSRIRTVMVVPLTGNIDLADAPGNVPRLPQGGWRHTSQARPSPRRDRS